MCHLGILIYIFQGILIIFCFNSSNIYVYYTFMFSICCFFPLFIIQKNLIYLIQFFLITQALIYTILHHSWGFVIRAFIYHPFIRIHICCCFISVTPLCITTSFQSLLIFLTFHHVLLSHFPQSNHFSCYPHVINLHNTLSQLGMCDLGIHLLPLPRYPQQFLFHFNSYLCVPHLYFQYLLIFLPLLHLERFHIPPSYLGV